MDVRTVPVCPWGGDCLRGDRFMQQVVTEASVPGLLPGLRGQLGQTDRQTRTDCAGLPRAVRVGCLCAFLPHVRGLWGT